MYEGFRDYTFVHLASANKFVVIDDAVAIFIEHTEGVPAV
jgi:hypothetical protein